MNARQLRTLTRVFAVPTRSDVTWPEVESLLLAVGAVVREGRGSRVRVCLGELILSLHAPHPQKEMRKYAVEQVREFLKLAGFTPAEEGGRQ